METIKDRLLRPDFNRSRFLEELKMTGSMTMMQYISKFIELSRFVLEFVSSKRLKMRRFEEGLAFYICNLLAGQLILIHQELYERAVEVELVKTELRALNRLIKRLSETSRELRARV